MFLLSILSSILFIIYRSQSNFNFIININILFILFLRYYIRKYNKSLLQPIKLHSCIRKKKINIYIKKNVHWNDDTLRSPLIQN